MLPSKAKSETVRLRPLFDELRALAAARLDHAIRPNARTLFVHDHRKIDFESNLRILSETRFLISRRARLVADAPDQIVVSSTVEVSDLNQLIGKDYRNIPVIALGRLPSTEIFLLWKELTDRSSLSLVNVSEATYTELVARGLRCVPLARSFKSARSETLTAKIRSVIAALKEQKAESIILTQKGADLLLEGMGSRSLHLPDAPAAEKNRPLVSRAAKGVMRRATALSDAVARIPSHALSLGLLLGGQYRRGHVEERIESHAPLAFVWFTCSRDYRYLEQSLKSVIALNLPTTFEIHIVQDSSDPLNKLQQKHVEFFTGTTIYFHRTRQPFGWGGPNVIYSELSFFYQLYKQNPDLLIGKIDSDTLFFNSSVITFALDNHASLLGQPYLPSGKRFEMTPFVQGGCYFLRPEILEEVDGPKILSVLRDGVRHMEDHGLVDFPEDIFLTRLVQSAGGTITWVSGALPPWAQSRDMWQRQLTSEFGPLLDLLSFTHYAGHFKSQIKSKGDR